MAGERHLSIYAADMDGDGHVDLLFDRIASPDRLVRNTDGLGDFGRYSYDLRLTARPSPYKRRTWMAMVIRICWPSPGRLLSLGMKTQMAAGALVKADGWNVGALASLFTPPTSTVTGDMDVLSVNPFRVT